MRILENGVAVCGSSHHAIWCAEQGLIHDTWMAGQICKHIKPGDVVIEGGAHIGTHTRPMLDAGARVIAFEPNGEACECLRHNCPEAHILPMGLSDKVGPAFLTRLDNAGASYLGETGDVVAATWKIDLLTDVPSLLVIDCEGYEAKALRGARETIAQCRPVLILECNRAALERAGDSDDVLFALIEEFGYDWRILQPECRRGDPQFDVECLPR